jgi:hypothetical protein
MGINVCKQLTANYYSKIRNICSKYMGDLAFSPPNVAIDNKARLDLPELTKISVVATYVASYNHPNTDKRYFMKVCSV